MSDPIGSDDYDRGVPNFEAFTNAIRSADRLSNWGRYDAHISRHRGDGTDHGLDPDAGERTERSAHTPCQSEMEGVLAPARSFPDAVGVAPVHPRSWPRRVLPVAVRRAANGQRPLRAVAAPVEDRDRRIRCRLERHLRSS